MCCHLLIAPLWNTDFYGVGDRGLLETLAVLNCLYSIGIDMWPQLHWDLCVGFSTTDVAAREHRRRSVQFLGFNIDSLAA